jgi:hypothetical protein
MSLRSSESVATEEAMSGLDTIPITEFEKEICTTDSGIIATRNDTEAQLTESAINPEIAARFQRCFLRIRCMIYFREIIRDKLRYGTMTHIFDAKRNLN